MVYGVGEYAVRSNVNIIAIDNLIFRQYIGKMKTPTHKMIFEMSEHFPSTK